MVGMMIGSLPMVTRIDSVHKIRGYSQITLLTCAERMACLSSLAYVQVLFQWATEHQYFDLLMIICTRLEVLMVSIE